MYQVEIVLTAKYDEPPSTEALERLGYAIRHAGLSVAGVTAIDAYYNPEASDLPDGGTFTVDRRRRDES